MLKKLALTLLAILVVFLGYVAMQPADYVITRATAINAPAENIFPYLNNSKLAEQWGPWTEVDPQAKMAYSGPDMGVGSQASWDSTGQLGTGSATIVESIPNQLVGIKLEYTRPMKMVQDSVYAIKPDGAGNSIVSWEVRGKNSFLGRLMCTFTDMDKVVGGMFEKGLSNLKVLVEKNAAK